MTNTFDTLGLNPVLLKTLRQIGHHTPTPIQVQAIPQVLEGRDLMGLAQTGTGKTAAFGLPLIQQLMGVGAKPQPRTARALILAPTRELVNQIATSLRAFTRPTHLRVTAVVGGAASEVGAVWPATVSSWWTARSNIARLGSPVSESWRAACAIAECMRAFATA